MTNATRAVGGRRRPAYRDLPLAGNGLPCSRTTLTAGDDMGTIGEVSRDVVLNALREVVLGDRISVCLPLDEPSPAFYGRSAPRHTIEVMPSGAQDDRLDGFYPQASTQWDGLRHRGDAELGYFGGVSAADAGPDGDRLGIGAWAAGIVTRAVLVDLAAEPPDEFDAFSRFVVTVDMIEGFLGRHGLTLRRGDVLLVRTGFVERYRSASRATRDAVRLAGRFVGLDASDHMARYLWDSGCVAVAVDNPGVEVAPPDPDRPSLHHRMLPMLGFGFGELFDFSALSAAAASDGRYTGVVMSVPLNLPRGVGSPANAVVMR